MLLDQSVEILQSTGVDGLDDLKVRLHCSFETRLSEDGSIGYITHQQLDYNQKLRGRLVKSAGTVRGWRLAGCRNEMIMRLGIVQLDGTNASEIVKKPGDLVV